MTEPPYCGPCETPMVPMGVILKDETGAWETSLHCTAQGIVLTVTVEGQVDHETYCWPWAEVFAASKLVNPAHPPEGGPGPMWSIR